MSRQSLKSLMYEILAHKEEINILFSSLNNGVVFFGDISLKMPIFTPAELGFLRAISWLYVLYIESGRINIEIIIQKINEFKIENSTEHTKHYDIVQKLRTYLQHNLSPYEKRNLLIQRDCEKWFLENASTALPTTEKQWRNCSVKLLLEAIDFLAAITKCIRAIESDVSKDTIILDWNARISRRHEPHQFDKLIQITASDMGRDNIDAPNLRKRYYDKWTRELGFLTINYNFEIEARKLIEHVLLFEMSKVLPITGKDIIEEFNVPPGPKVGELLDIARAIYEEKFCSKLELLEKVSKRISEIN